MDWTEKHDIYLCREVLVVEPFRFRKGSVEKGKLWSNISESLNASTELRFKVNQRGVRERFMLLQTKYQQKNRADEQSSGTCDEMTELDVLLEEIGEKEQVAEENMAKNNNNKKLDADRAKAEETRRVAMERVGETKKRKNDEEDGEKNQKRTRRSGADTVEYLREKSKIEKDLREKELEIKKAEVQEQVKRGEDARQQMQDMLTAMQQQQLQNQNVQTMLMQQQQQQNLAILALIENLSKKQT